MSKKINDLLKWEGTTIIISERIKDMQSRLFSDIFSYFDRMVEKEGFKYE